MTEAPAIDIKAADRIIDFLSCCGDPRIVEAAALLRQLIPAGADHRKLAGHLASLAGHSMDKALGLC